MSQPKKKILITFGRSFLALELARLLSAAGHEIYITDSLRFPITRFSNAVKKSFITPSPRFNPKGYINQLVKIINDNQIDFLLPIYEETSYIAAAIDQFPTTCKVFCPPFELYDTLHNKWKFQEKLRELNIPTLKSVCVKSNKDLSKISFTTSYALKACYSRASQSVIKVYPGKAPNTLETNPYNPWIAQEWMDGEKYCTYTICHEGKIYAHSAYPVKHAIDGKSCLIYTSIEHPKIEQWIENLVSKINYTGQIAFDFVQSKDGQLFAIECNPRATSGLMIFNKKSGLDKAFFKTSKEIIFPKKNASVQIATGMMLYGWRKSAVENNTLLSFFKTLLTTRDVVLNPRDIKPFLFEAFVFTTLWKDSKKYQLPLSASFTYDHDWNGELKAVGRT